MTGTAVRAAATALWFLAGSSALESAGLYSETTGGASITTLTTVDRLPSGYGLHSRMSDGDQHDVEMDRDTATVSYHVASPKRGIDYTVVRHGDLLVFAGVFGGKPFTRSQKIDGHPWFESLEVTLAEPVMAGSTTPLVFWIVNPWDAHAYLMQARFEGRETVPVNGVPTEAERVKVQPAGILSILWSALYWYRPADGAYLRYRAVRGGPGTPETVVELIGPD